METQDPFCAHQAALWQHWNTKSNHESRPNHSQQAQLPHHGFLCEQVATQYGEPETTKVKILIILWGSTHTIGGFWSHLAFVDFSLEFCSELWVEVTLRLPSDWKKKLCLGASNTKLQFRKHFLLIFYNNWETNYLSLLECYAEGWGDVVGFGGEQKDTYPGHHWCHPCSLPLQDTPLSTYNLCAIRFAWKTNHFIETANKGIAFVYTHTLRVLSTEHLVGSYKACFYKECSLHRQMGGCRMAGCE